MLRIFLFIFLLSLPAVGGIAAPGNDLFSCGEGYSWLSSAEHSRPEHLMSEAEMLTLLKQERAFQAVDSPQNFVADYRKNGFNPFAAARLSDQDRVSAASLLLGRKLSAAEGQQIIHDHGLSLKSSANPQYQVLLDSGVTGKFSPDQQSLLQLLHPFYKMAFCIPKSILDTLLGWAFELFPDTTKIHEGHGSGIWTMPHIHVNGRHYRICD